VEKEDQYEMHSAWQSLRASPLGGDDEEQAGAERIISRMMLRPLPRHSPQLRFEAARIAHPSSRQGANPPVCSSLLIESNAIPRRCNN